MHIYLTNILLLQDCFAEALPLLNPRRQARVLRYLQQADKLRCLAVGLLLRLVLKVTDDAHICLGPHGKPTLAGDGPCFSIAHAGDYAALSVGTCPHGLDMEGISPVELPVARHCMMPEELSLYRASAHPDSLFAQLWTGKESVMKATGLGMHLSPQSFSLLPLGDGERIVLGQSWFMYQQEFQKYWISLATAEPQEGLEIVQLEKAELLHIVTANGE